MKKVLPIIMSILSIAIIFTACGNKEGKKTSAKKDNEKKTESVTVKKDIPKGDFKEMGKGEFFIDDQPGTSKDGNVPIFMMKKGYLADGDDFSTFDICFQTNEFDATKATKIYVDGVCQQTAQLGDSASSFPVPQELRTEGKHKVEVLQLDDNDEVVTYKSCQFEIKALD